MTDPDAPASRALGRILLALLLSCWAAAVVGRNLPDPRPAGAPEGDFSAVRAQAVIAEVARAPHPAASPELERVRGFLLEELRAMGFAPELQRGEINGVPLANILVRIPGAAPTGTLLCVAHYDSVPRGPGAGDDTVGVACWLEVFRALRARGWQPTNDVALLLTDGEELGLYGARLFRSEHPWMESVACVINLEAIGNGGPAVLFQLGPENGACVRAFARSVDAPAGTSLGDAVYRRMPNDTDLTVFLRGGIPGFNFALTCGSTAYHAPHDTPENLDPRSVQHMGESAMSLAMHMGSAELGLLRAGDRTFFDVLGYGLVHYAKGWDVVVALLAAALAIGACSRAQPKPGRLASHALGHLLELLLVTAGVAFLWWILDRDVGRSAEEAAWVRGNTTSGALLFLGILALVAGYEVVRADSEWGREPARAAAIALLWSAASIASIVWLPGASFAFAWPSIFATLGTPAASGKSPGRRVAGILTAGWLGALLLGLPILHLLLQLLLRQPVLAVCVITPVLVSAAGLFAIAFQRIRRDVPWARGALLGTGVAALLAAALVAHMLEWRQGALLP